MVYLQKTFNGDGPGMVKPLKNHRWQWCLGKKTLTSHRFEKITIVEVYTGPCQTRHSYIAGNRSMFTVIQRIYDEYKEKDTRRRRMCLH